MKKIANIRTIVGLIIIFFALWSPRGDDTDIKLINIDKPTQVIIDTVSPISNIITDPTDRAKLAIFNQTFANRVKNYDADLQQINDIYVLAASCFFENTLLNKYEDLDKMVVSLLEKSVGSENSKLTQEDKQKLSDNFMGLAWSLVHNNKGN